MNSIYPVDGGDHLMKYSKRSFAKRFECSSLFSHLEPWQQNDAEIRTILYMALCPILGLGLVLLNMPEGAAGAVRMFIRVLGTVCISGLTIRLIFLALRGTRKIKR